MKDITFLKESRIAHRGIYDNKRIYENTINAFSRAIKYNFMIELDIRILKDGNIVCFHDDDMSRLLNVEGAIEDLTYEELVYMAKYQIPLFTTVLDLVDGKVPLLIELKSNTRKHLLEKKVVEILDRYDGIYAIQSFSLKHLKWFLKNKKDYVVGLLINKKNLKRLYNIKKYDFININISLLEDKKVRKIREDKLVIGYTIDNKEEFIEKKDVYDNLVINNILEIIDIK